MSVPLRITMASRRVHPAHGPGGMERKVHDLTIRLAAKGVQIDLYTETPADMARVAAASAAMPDGVVIHWVPGRWLPIGDATGTVVLDRITNYPIWARRVARWVRASQPEPPAVVHAHGLVGWGFAKHDVGAPMILTVEGLEEFQVPAGLKRLAYTPFRACVRGAAAASAAVVATDASLQGIVEASLGVAVAEQRLIPNAVDLADVGRLADPQRGRLLLEQFGLAGASPLFFSIGRVEHNKGFDVMAEALGSIADRLPTEFGWVLVGDGPALQTTREVASRAGIGGRCRFTGRLPDADLHSLAAVADWFVVPTRYEGSSIVTLEAMAHGLPVIASSTGGLPDKVEEGVTGFLVPPGEPEPLGEALLRAVEADGPAMGRAGRELCALRFSWEVIVDRYIDLYREVGTSQSPRGGRIP